MKYGDFYTMIYMKISIYIFNRYLNNEKWTGGFRFRKNREWKGKNETNKKVFIISGFIIWSFTYAYIIT